MRSNLGASRAGISMPSSSRVTLMRRSNSTKVNSTSTSTASKLSHSRHSSLAGSLKLWPRSLVKSNHFKKASLLQVLTSSSMNHVWELSRVQYSAEVRISSWSLGLVPSQRSNCEMPSCLVKLSLEQQTKMPRCLYSLMFWKQWKMKITWTRFLSDSTQKSLRRPYSTKFTTR